MENQPERHQQPVDRIRERFELEEYKQVLNERQFVMTRYMQAVGLYVTLSGLGLKQLAEASEIPRVWFLALLFTSLNVVASIAARKFRDMANNALEREKDFVKKYQLRQMQDLFWGYYAGVFLVIASQTGIVVISVFRINHWPI